MVKKVSTSSNRLLMSPSGLAALASDVFGETWRSALPEYLGVSYSQLNRYMILKQDMPRLFVVALAALHQIKESGAALPDISGMAIERKKAVPVRFVQTAKPKPDKPDDPTPLADFSFDLPPDSEPVTADPAPEPAKPKPRKEKPVAAVPAPETKAQRDARKKREKRAAEKAAKAKAA